MSIYVLLYIMCLLNDIISVNYAGEYLMESGNIFAIGFYRHDVKDNSFISQDSLSDNCTREYFILKCFQSDDELGITFYTDQYRQLWYVKTTDAEHSIFS